MTTSATKKQPIRFEQAMSRLEQIIQLLDNPETGLEEMIPLVEEGLSLIRSSKELLKNAELRIRTLENPQETAPEATPPQPAPQNDDGFSLQ